MPVHVQDRGDFTTGVFGLVQDRCRLEAGQDFEPKLAHAVTFSGVHQAEVLELASRLDPFSRPSVKGDILEDVTAQAPCFGSPLIGATRSTQRGNLRRKVLSQLERGDPRRLNGLLKNGAHLSWRSLGGDESQAGEYGQKQQPEERSCFHDFSMSW